MSLFADHNLPFAVALAVMIALALAQVFGLGDFGGDADMDLDADGDLDAGALDGLLSILGIGRVPFTMWLALFLFLFAAIGVSGQALAQSLTGSPLDRALAAILAVVPAVPLTGLLTRPLARILPHDETTAVSIDSLVGRRATIVTGRAAAGCAARAKVIDHHGHPHHVMVEPHDAEAAFQEGEDILLVRREGEAFYAVGVEERRLAPTTD